MVVIVGDLEEGLEAAPAAADDWYCFQVGQKKVEGHGRTSRELIAWQEERMVDVRAPKW